MLIPAPPCYPQERSTSRKIEQYLSHFVAVEQKSLVLVVEAHEALVASSLAIHLLVFACPAEMAGIEAFLGDTRDRVGFFHVPPQDARPTFRSLIEKNRAVVIPPNAFRFDFALVELECLLQTPLQGVLKCCFNLGISPQIR